VSRSSRLGKRLTAGKLTVKQLAVIEREEFMVWAVEAIVATHVEDMKNQATTMWDGSCEI
jgi:hypothetical protein